VLSANTGMLALSERRGEPRRVVEGAENAQKIGELNITPDLLKALLNDRKP